MPLMRCIDPEKIIPISRSTTEVFKTGTWSRRRPEHRDKVSPCRAACPAGNNITQALFHAAQGDFDGALERAASDWGTARPTLLTEDGRDYPVAVVG